MLTGYYRATSRVSMIRRLRWSRCQSLKSNEGQTIVAGLLVSHSQEFISFYTEHGSVVLKYPQGAKLIRERMPESCSVIER
jgi:hypothetical protein